MSLLNRAQQIVGAKEFTHSATFDKDVTFKQHITGYSPVASEPSLGTPHWRGNSTNNTKVLNQGAVLAGAWYDVVFTNAPAGAKCAYAACLATLAVAGGIGLAARKNGDTVAGGAGSEQMVQIYVSPCLVLQGLLKIPLDSAKTGEICSYAAAASLVCYDALFYDC